MDNNNLLYSDFAATTVAWFVLLENSNLSCRCGKIIYEFHLIGVSHLFMRMSFHLHVIYAQ
jgi:hypothetical protein